MSYNFTEARRRHLERVRKDGAIAAQEAKKLNKKSSLERLRAAYERDPNRSLRDIANEAKLSPTYAAKLFRRDLGGPPTKGHFKAAEREDEVKAITKMIDLVAKEYGARPREITSTGIKYRILRRLIWTAARDKGFAWASIAKAFGRNSKTISDSVDDVYRAMEMERLCPIQERALGDIGELI